MDGDDVFPAEMPDHPSRPIPPLDDDTAGRLLAGRLDPDDAPPSYAAVARLLRAAAAPAGPEELVGEEAAVALFRAAGVGGRPGGVGGAGVGGPSGLRDHPAGVRGRSGRRRRTGRVRGRLVAVALAGVLVVGGAAAAGAAGGLWTTDGVPSSGRLRSPTGGPGAGGAGSGVPAFRFGSGSGSVTGSGGSVTGSDGPGLRRPAGSPAVTDGERAANGVRPVPAPEAKADKAKAPKPGKPAARKPAPKGPKATPGQGANHPGGRPG